MQLLQSWKNSLQLLYPKNVWQFCLLVLNNMLCTARILAGRCWLLGIFLLVIPAFKIFGVAIAIFFLLLLSRPSVEIKDRSYIWKYTETYFLRCALILFIGRLLGKVGLLGTILFIITIFGGDQLNFLMKYEIKDLFMLYTPVSIYPFVVLLGVFFTFSSSIEVIMLLFLLDNGSEPRKQKSLYIASLERALRMVWRNMPIFMLCSLVAAGVYVLEMNLWITASQGDAQQGITSMSFLVGLVWLVQSWIATATLSVLYTKFFYENPRLYTAIK